MDESTAGFVATFQAFLEEVVHDHRRRQDEDDAALIPLLHRHLGAHPRQLPVVTEDIPVQLFVDLDIALSEVQQRADGHQLIGIGGGDQRRHQSLSEILDHARRFGFPLAAVDYKSIATGPETARETVSFGLRLFTYEGAPVVVLQRAAEPRFGQMTARMEILTPMEGVAAELIATVRALMVDRSVLRRQVLSLGGSSFERGIGDISFHRRPAVRQDDVILPAGVLDRVRRHVAGIAEHRDQLRAAGQHLKRGLLLYGPPGTGKTHTVRYLLGALPELTVLLLAGPAIVHVTEAARMARALQPALIVLEDCDLVADNRDRHAGPQPLLFAVLETLDGLGDDADVAFLLTTNRVDALEPALAQRPGRVDLAVEIPLPDADARRRLMRLYARDVPLTDEALQRAADRSEGTTASFAKELLRRAVLIAADAGHTPADSDLDQALDEMLSQTESITRALLGAQR